MNAIVEGKKNSQVKSTDNIVNKNNRRKFHSPKKEVPIKVQEVNITPNSSDQKGKSPHT